MLDYVLLESKEWDEIIRHWNQFIELVPDNDRAYLERAGTYYHKKEYARSLNDLKASCDLGNVEACSRYNKFKNRWQ